MYGTSGSGVSEAAESPTCPACGGRTYFVDPEQTVITCYECGRYFRRKKEDKASPGPSAPAPPETPPPPPPPEAPEFPGPPSVPEAPPAAAAPPPPPPPPPPEPESYFTRSAAVEVEAAVREEEEAVEEDDGFDLMLSETAPAEEPVEEPMEEQVEEAPRRVRPVPVRERQPEAVPAEEDEMVACSICGFPMDEDWKVCPNCVTRYETTCRSCGRTLQPWWLICPWCETPKPADEIQPGR